MCNISALLLDDVDESYYSSEWAKNQMFVEVFEPVHHGRVCGCGAGVTTTQLLGSTPSKMHDLEKWLQESEQNLLKANICRGQS